MNFLKNVLLGLFFICLPFMHEGNFPIGNAITGDQFGRIRFDLAIIHHENEFKDLEKWQQVCHGIFISPKLVLTTRHKLDLNWKYWVNGYDAHPVISFFDSDLVVFRSKKANNFKPLVLCLNPGIGEEVYTCQVFRNHFYWKSAGFVEAVSPDEIYLSGFRASEGESGKPVFTKQGELIGLIRRKDAEKIGTALIPASKLHSFFNN
jgi:hypothetical protein